MFPLGFTDPVGWKCTDSGDVCVEEEMQPAGNMHTDAIPNCAAKQARVCSHSDLMAICGTGYNPFAGQSRGWYGEHGYVVDPADQNANGDGDDEFGTWNRAFCDLNNDGAAEHAYNALPFKCCKGAPRSCPAGSATSGGSCSGTVSVTADNAYALYVNGVYQAPVNNGQTDFGEPCEELNPGTATNLFCIGCYLRR